MKIAFVTSKVHGGRGIGTYSKFLLSELRLLTKSKDFTIEEVPASEVGNTKYDIVHYPFFDFFFNTLPVKRNYKTVVTIHDTIPLIYPTKFPPGVKGKLRFQLQKHALKSVEKVITVSETAKKDIVRFLPVGAEDIVPIYHGPSVYIDHPYTKSDQRSIIEKYDLPKKFVIYVGDVGYHKNIVNLAKGVLKTDYDLILIGKSFEKDKSDINHPELTDFRELIKIADNNKRIKFLGFVPQGDLETIFPLAHALIQPSYYEGFGISILDAIALKLPVIASYIQVFKELYEDTLTYFSPDNYEEIAKCIKALENKKIRNNMILKGYNRAKAFSWKKCALETLEVYKSVYESKKK